ncbi:hypothetical protein CKG00_13720 [Morganella morganii]|uniref:Uncharacterized protein n=1 Tax=Morganella morganii TaxID=582 RepID=A0A433ZYU3_MORMO|nr:hypothetical protein CKG00_13720 [Morganella morganii]
MRSQNKHRIYIAGIRGAFGLLFVICTECSGNISPVLLFYFIVKTVSIICCISELLLYYG